MIRISPFVAIFLAVLSFASAEEKPDILFLFADDQCFETIGKFGYTDIETPNLDRLVERGTTFTHAYNMGSWSGAVCVASRAMLNTGAFVWNAQQIIGLKGKEKTEEGNKYPDFPENDLMWSQLLHDAGYETYFTGKWHVQTDAGKVFDVARNIRAGMPDQTKLGYNRPVVGEPDTWSPFDESVGGFWEGGTHWSEVVGDDGVDFLKMGMDDGKPSFFYVAFNAPHDPRQSPKEFVDRYPLDRIEVPENFLPEYPYKDSIDNSEKLRDEALAPFPRTELAVKTHRQEYYAIITHMDEQIGRILDALDESGKADNTYVFFTADHGLAVGHHGLMGKQTLHDHSTRVPFMVAGPGVEAGAKNDAPIYLQDIMATSLDLANVEKPEHVQFQSLKPIWEGKASGYDSIYGAYLESQRSIVKDGYKLLLYPKIPLAQLFELESDPQEMTNILETKEPLAKELFAEFLKLQAETGDTLDVAAVYPDLAL